MRLAVVRGGGVAGIATSTELDGDSLAPEDAAELVSRVDRAGLWEREEPAVTPLAPDETSYEIAVEHGGRRRTLRLAESAMPEDLRALIAWAEGVPGRTFRVERGR